MFSFTFFIKLRTFTSKKESCENVRRLVKGHFIFVDAFLAFLHFTLHESIM